MAEFIASKTNTWDVIGMSGSETPVGTIQYDERYPGYGFAPNEDLPHILCEETVTEISDFLAFLNSEEAETAEENDFEDGEEGHSYVPLGPVFTTGVLGGFTVFLACKCGDVIQVTPRKVEAKV